MNKPPRIALTPGEPAGIGPDLVLSLAQQSLPGEIVAIADPDLLESRAAQIGVTIHLVEWRPDRPAAAHQPGTLLVEPVRMARPARAGRLDTGNATYVLDTLQRGVELCTNNACRALVTAPVQKSVINEAGIPFTGHTEFLAERTNAPRPVMLLAAPGLRVALVTTHMPLSQVSSRLTRDDLTAVIRILDQDVRNRFAVPNPRLLVTGLNPHAGEGGHLGQEENRIISPVIEALKKEGLALEGPVPADTAFTPPRLESTDAVLTMYHDQGLPVIKHMGFGCTVNVTLGLPIIRTSVDHGTALDLAGTGRADPSSLLEAVGMAMSMAGR